MNESSDSFNANPSNGGQGNDKEPNHVLSDDVFKCSIADGHRWVFEGIALFWKEPMIIVLTSLVFIAMITILSFTPLLSMLAYILTMVCMGGIYYGFHSLDNGGTYSIQHLFIGFKRYTRQLVLLGLAYLGSMIALLVVSAIIASILLAPDLLPIVESIGPETDDVYEVMSQVEAALLELTQSEKQMLFSKINVVMLVALAALMPIMMLFLFAPILIIIHGIEPIDAMKRSFKACVRNFWALTWWNVVISILIVVGIFTVFGMIFVMPIIFASLYIAYKCIFITNISSDQIVVAA